MNTAGPDFENIEETSAKLGFKSIRLVRQMLMKWRSTLEKEEIKSFQNFIEVLLNLMKRTPFII